MSIGSVFNCNNTSDFILTLVDLVKIFQRTKYFLRTVTKNIQTDTKKPTETTFTIFNNELIDFVRQCQLHWFLTDTLKTQMLF